MIKILPELRKSHLLRSGVWLSALNLMTGLLAYIFQLLMGKVLSAEDFGMFNAILALNMVICSPIGAPQAVASRYVAILAVTSGLASTRFLYRKWTIALWMVSGVAAFLVAVGADYVKRWLGIPDRASLALLGGLVLLNVLSLVNGTFLHGLQAFRSLGLIPFGAVVSKIAFCLFFVVICGAGLQGALMGVAVSTAAVFFVGFYVVSRLWLNDSSVGRPDLPFPWALVIPVVAGSMGLTSMTQLDLILVHRYFHPEVASQYALAAVLGKAVLYLPGGIVLAILPIVAASHARKENSNRDATQALWATASMCAVAAAAYFLAGQALVGRIYGEKFGQAGRLLAFYGLAMVPLAMAMVMQGFLVAKGRMVYSWVLAVLAALEWDVISTWHPSLPAVVASLASFNLLGAVAGGALMARECRKVS